MGATCSVIPEVPANRDALNAKAAKQRNQSSTSIEENGSSTERLGLGSDDRRMDLVGPAGHSGSYRKRFMSVKSTAGCNTKNTDEFDAMPQAQSTQGQPSLTDATTMALTNANPTPVRERPKSTRQFHDLIANSLLLRYHPDRVTMFSRLRGGCVTPEGVQILTIRERLDRREEESSTGEHKGEGHLYFLDPERPLPVPLAAIPPIDISAALAAWIEYTQCTLVPDRLEAERLARQNLSVHLTTIQASLLESIESLQRGVSTMDFDAAFAACQQCMVVLRQNNILQPLAIALQVLLTMNDILVIEHVGHTFEEAVRAYFQRSEVANDTMDDKGQEVPDLTTVLELYTLLNGGYQDKQRISRNVGSASSRRQLGSTHTSNIRVEGAEVTELHCRVANLDGSTVADEGSNVAKLSLRQISLSANAHDEAPLPRGSSPNATLTAGGSLSASTNHHHNTTNAFQPTLFAPFNVSNSETGIALAAMSHTRTSHGASVASAHGLMVHSNSASGTAVSGGQLSAGSFMQLQEFHLPKVIGGDNVQQEIQLQLVEQVHVLLEVQQMLHDTLDYLIRVLQFHIEVRFPAVSPV